jgi:hypothetical protein
MKNRDVADEFSNVSGRLGALFWLAAVVANEYPPDPLEDFAEEGPEFWEKVFELTDLEGYDRRDGFIEMLLDRELFGFLARVETPVITYAGDSGNCLGYSWGHYRTEWLYAETIEELKDKALEWIESSRESDIKTLKEEEE